MSDSWPHSGTNTMGGQLFAYHVPTGIFALVVLSDHDAKGGGEPVAHDEIDLVGHLASHY